jgi:hypothetical protein
MQRGVRRHGACDCAALRLTAAAADRC